MRIWSSFDPMGIKQNKSQFEIGLASLKQFSSKKSFFEFDLLFIG